ncbi:MAG: DUF4199 domain-containing protein [Bacteroidales bacterium]|nr:DUF4199 domain-containing protein [Bacteroidales bacterium]
MLLNKNQFRHILIYGAITGGAIFFLLMLGFIFGNANNPNIQFICILLFITGVMLSTKKFRDLQPEKTLSYGLAFRTSFFTGLVIGIIWAVYGYILYTASPGLLEEMMHEAQEAYLQLGWSEEDVTDMVEQSSAISMAFAYFFSSVLYGGILSLIVGAIFFRRRNPLISQTPDNE